MIGKKNNNGEILAPQSKSSFGIHLSKKKLVYLGCTILCVIFIIIIVVVIVKSISKEPITDDYFVSDDTKSVIFLESDSSVNNIETPSKKTYVVYTYDGDNITSLKTYFEYPDADSARAALESLKENSEFTNAELNDKYIIVTTDPSQYQGLTVSDVKQQAEAIQQLQDANKNSSSQSDESSEEQPEEPSGEFQE